MAAGALEGLRVIDLTHALSGPFCTMLLADLGADVLKVEPLHGDGTRRMGPFAQGDETKLFGGYFHSVNRNKRSLALDLTDERGRQVLRRLLADADVLVENYREGVMDRFGLSFEALHAEFPKLVYACILALPIAFYALTHYGRRGASFAALDGVQLQGVLQLALTVGGTLTGPQLGGTMARDLRDRIVPPRRQQVKRRGREPHQPHAVRLDLLPLRAPFGRDRLGQRPLAYARLKNGWLIASREETLLAHPDVDSALNETFLVTHFALVDPLPGCALYLGAKQVEHGTRIDIKGSVVRIRRLEYTPDADVARLSDAEAARRFREILEASVADCCRGVERLGLQLSAGLDSSAVAALLPAAFRTRGTLAVNYGTNLDHGIDERPLAAKLASRLGLSLVSLDTADYPASMDVGNDHDPSYPYVNPYRPLKRAVHETFASAGCDVVLTGDFGDHWEAPARTWLLDALAHRRMDVVASSLAGILLKRGALAIWRDAGVRHALGRLARRKENPAEYHWLRPHWRELARTQSVEARERFRHWPLPAHTAYNLGSLSALDAAYERH
mgnify:CR=1 FL=1